MWQLKGNQPNIYKVFLASWTFLNDCNWMVLKLLGMVNAMPLFACLSGHPDVCEFALYKLLGLQ